MSSSHSYYYDESLYDETDQKIPETDASAQKKEVKSAKTGEDKVVEFVIGTQGFAVDLFETKEVINSPEITPIPNTPGYIRGMTNLRGVITTVIDLQAFLSVKETGTTGEVKKKERVIILDPSICHKAVGIVVDDVRSVQNYREDEIDLNDRAGERYQLGVIKKQTKTTDDRTRSELVILLDIKGIIDKIKDEL
ncbi:MAG TPA: chemotaxis protein CheW [Methanospirillum sp.]|jgi:purine-binding chemotaxis protein CheW|nr:chemotaxis protein CheW [Methanospirillum sp.]